MATIAFIGFGELAGALAEGLAGGGRHRLRAYVRREPAPGSSRQRLLAGAQISASRQLSEVLNGADAVLVAVPGAACRTVAQACAPLLAPGTLYVDLAAAPPAAKVQAGELVAGRGAGYADAAVLGTVVTSGARVPILVSGPGAERFRLLVEQDGLLVTTLDAPAGAAARVKLLRSVYLKGRDALILEMMLAARRHGVEKIVMQSIEGPGERVTFPALVDRVLCSLAVHAERRGQELDDAGEVLADAGVDPALARAGARTLRELARLRLSDDLGGERPRDGDTVLAEIDARWPRESR